MNRPPAPSVSRGVNPRRARWAVPAALVLLALLAAFGHVLGAWGGPPPAVPRPRPRAPMPRTPPRERPSPPPADAAAPAPPPRDPWAEAVADPSWRRLPVGEEGPVVIGVLVLEGDGDPPAWVALESVEDPEREDPSRVEGLGHGRFRMRGFPPGRYRVRALGDGCVAVRSGVLDTRPAAVSDAGVLRLRPEGSLTGVVLSPEGLPVDARVRVVDRDPASLRPGITQDGWSRGERGFALRGNVPERIRLLVDGDEGWALLDFHPDPDGGGHVAVPLTPWSVVTVSAAPPLHEGAPRVVLGEIEARPAHPDAPEVAVASRRRVGAGALRLTPGAWSIGVRWTADEPGTTPPSGVHREDLVLAPADRRLVEVRR